MAAPKEGGLVRMVSRSLALALLLLVLALGAAVIAVPRIANAIPLTVLTSSMEPGLPPGTLLIVKPVATDDIRVGDVVTYQIRPNVPGVITHRVTSVNLAADGTRTFIFKGDNNSVADKDPVVEGQVMGRVWYSVPLIGFVNTSTGGSARAWLIPVGASVLLLYAAATIVRGVVAARRRKRRAPSHGVDEQPPVSEPAHALDAERMVADPRGQSRHVARGRRTTAHRRGRVTRNPPR
ncbi:signal peptidase I [Herbiconiux liukaitaii]|uniref:signal peptidase I n=1 Tax=Herbiconiux liukaitaii TaxID=3342799 RepID=UPI0035BAFD40